MTEEHLQPEEIEEEPEEERRRRWILWLLLLLLLLLIGVCGVVFLGDGEDETAAGTTTTTQPAASTVAETQPPAPTTSTTQPPTTTSTTLPPSAAIVGVWVFTVNVTDVNGSVCQGEIGDVYERDVTIAAEGDQLVVVGLDDLNDPDDPAWTGSFEDGTLVFEGTRAEDDGLTTARFEMTLSADGTSFEGEETWTWDWTSRGETGTCTEGKSTVTAVKKG